MRHKIYVICKGNV